jgi:predicted TIM-barrel fold metal-dependent hydrolase
MRMRIIDFHVHIFPDAVAAKAIPMMEESAEVETSFDGTFDGMLAARDAAGIDTAVLQPVATKPEQVRSINDWTAALAGERVVPFGAMHPDFDDPAAEIERMRGLGIRGIKLHPEFQACAPDDARMHPIYEAAEKAGLILLFHAGIDIGIPTLFGPPTTFTDIYHDFPELRIVLAHMGGFQCWDDVQKHLIGLPLWLDTSYSLGHMPDEQFLEMVRAHSHNRVLFGTDAPWADMAEEVRLVGALPLEPAERAAIMHGTAEALLGM